MKHSPPFWSALATSWPRKAIAILAVPLLMAGCSILRPPEPEVLAKPPEPEVVHTPEKAMEAEGLYLYETPGGVQYVITEEGQGDKLQQGMEVAVHYRGRLDDPVRTPFDSSYDREEALRFVLGKGMVIPGWEEALTELRVGDKARLWVPYPMAYGEQGRGPIPPRTNLVFEMDVLQARHIQTPEAFATEGLDTLHTESGMQLIMVQEGSGETPRPGNILTVHYSAYLSDGSLFDSSVQRQQAIQFVLGAGQVIPGLDEAFLYLKKGSKTRLILPPHLAYGEEGSDKVPPNESLIFDVELIDIGM